MISWSDVESVCHPLGYGPSGMELRQTTGRPPAGANMATSSGSFRMKTPPWCIMLTPEQFVNPLSFSEASGGSVPIVSARNREWLHSATVTPSFVKIEQPLPVSDEERTRRSISGGRYGGLFLYPVGGKHKFTPPGFDLDDEEDEEDEEEENEDGSELSNCIKKSAKKDEIEYSLASLNGIRSSLSDFILQYLPTTAPKISDFLESDVDFLRNPIWMPILKSLFANGDKLLSILSRKDFLQVSSCLEQMPCCCRAVSEAPMFLQDHSRRLVNDFLQSNTEWDLKSAWRRRQRYFHASCLSDLSPKLCRKLKKKREVFYNEPIFKLLDLMAMATLYLKTMTEPPFLHFGKTSVTSSKHTSNNKINNNNNKIINNNNKIINNNNKINTTKTTTTSTTTTTTTTTTATATAKQTSTTPQQAATPQERQPAPLIDPFEAMIREMIGKGFSADGAWVQLNLSPVTSEEFMHTGILNGSLAFHEFCQLWLIDSLPDPKGCAKLNLSTKTRINYLDYKLRNMETELERRSKKVCPLFNYDD